MKKIVFLLLALAAISFSSCVIVADTPGPAGYPGRAYYGISYDYNPPYSYWDNNMAMPESPYFDEYYPTGTGVYDFEYFVDRDLYWYGTYQIWLNPGEPGRPYGEPGRNGMDTYLMLICNEDGPYEFRKSDAASPMTVNRLADGTVEYTITNGDGGMKVTMKKATTAERPAQKPKYVRK